MSARVGRATKEGKDIHVASPAGRENSAESTSTSLDDLRLFCLVLPESSHLFLSIKVKKA